MISERRRGWLHAVFPKSLGNDHPTPRLKTSADCPRARPRQGRAEFFALPIRGAAGSRSPPFSRRIINSVALSPIAAAVDIHIPAIALYRLALITATLYAIVIPYTVDYPT